MRSRTGGVVGALAVASLLMAACTDTPKRDLASEQRELEGTGGSGPVARHSKRPQAPAAMNADAGTADAGTSGGAPTK